MRHDFSFAQTIEAMFKFEQTLFLRLTGLCVAGKAGEKSKG